MNLHVYGLFLAGNRDAICLMSGTLKREFKLFFFFVHMPTGILHGGNGTNERSAALLNEGDVWTYALVEILLIFNGHTALKQR